MAQPRPGFYLAQGNSGPGSGLLTTRDGKPALALFTTRDRAAAFYEARQLAPPWAIHCSHLFVFQKWLDVHHSRGIRQAIVDPDTESGAGTTTNVFDLILDLDR